MKRRKRKKRPRRRRKRKRSFNFGESFLRESFCFNKTDGEKMVTIMTMTTKHTKQHNTKQHIVQTFKKEKNKQLPAYKTAAVVALCSHASFVLMIFFYFSTTTFASLLLSTSFCCSPYDLFFISKTIQAIFW